MTKHIILDLGNWNNHKNDWAYIKKTIDSVIPMKTEKSITIKFQIWKSGNKLINPTLKSTSWNVFDKAYHYCNKHNLRCTTSVFDEESRDTLLCEYPVEFVKIACIPELYNLVTDKMLYVVSVSNNDDYKKVLDDGNVPLLCIRKYPAQPLDYIHLIENSIEFDMLDIVIRGLSDHTCDFKLYEHYQPYWYECHFALERKSDDPFGNEFVRTPEELRSIL